MSFLSEDYVIIDKAGDMHKGRLSTGSQQLIEAEVSKREQALLDELVAIRELDIGHAECSAEIGKWIATKRQALNKKEG